MRFGYLLLYLLYSFDRCSLTNIKVDTESFNVSAFDNRQVLMILFCQCYLLILFICEAKKKPVVPSARSDTTCKQYEMAIFIDTIIKCKYLGHAISSANSKNSNLNESLA